MIEMLVGDCHCCALLGGVLMSRRFAIAVFMATFGDGLEGSCFYYEVKTSHPSFLLSVNHHHDGKERRHNATIGDG